MFLSCPVLSFSHLTSGRRLLLEEGSCMVGTKRLSVMLPLFFKRYMHVSDTESIYDQLVSWIDVIYRESNLAVHRTNA